MVCMLIEVRVKPEALDEFLDVITYDAVHSEADEPGCLRFDVHQSSDDASQLWLYEVYVNKEAFRYHIGTPHAKKWADTVVDWYVSEPPPSYRGGNIWPPDNWGWSSGNPRA